MSEPRLEHLANGIRLITLENPVIEVVAAHFAFGVSPSAIPTSQAGLAHLLAAVLTKGTTHHSSHDIALCFADWGARLSVEVNTDTLELNSKCMAAEFSQMLALIAEVIQSPQFPEAEVEREQLLLLQTIRTRHEQALGSLYELVCRHLYGDHPYAEAFVGTVETVSALRPQDLLAAHQRLFQPDNLVITVVGSLSASHVRTLVEQQFAQWQPLPPPPAPPAPGIPSYHATRLTLNQPSQQTTLLLAYLGCSVFSPDYLPLSLLVNYLGNGLSSRLFVEMREKQGLAYEVSAFFSMRRDPAPLVVYLATAAANTDQALTQLRQEMTRLCQNPLTESEWLATQRKVLGHYALGQQTNSQTAQRLGWFEVMGLGYGFARDYPQLVMQSTPDMGWTVAKKYLQDPIVALAGSPQTLAIVSVENQCLNAT
ncbi:MAG: pitrilysin family protein [Synechococcales cyanobacterium]